MRQQAKKKLIVRDYYNTYFEDEFGKLIECLSDETTMFEIEMKYRLQQIGFLDRKIGLSYETDMVFGNINAEQNGKQKSVFLSAELYNPLFGEEDKSNFYSRLIEKTEAWIEQKT